MRRVLSVLLLPLLWGVLPSLHAASIDGVRLWRAPDHTRVVFDLDAPVTHEVFNLSGPDRLVLDIQVKDNKANLATLDLSDTPISNIRSGRQSGGELRVVFDLNAKVNPRSFVLKKFEDKPDRLVVDLYDSEKKTVKHVDDIVNIDNNQKRDVIIAIDAGHGGEDPGAVGGKRIYEKDVVLLVAKNLANIVNATPGYKALLIRDGDYFISLGDRPEKARQKKADFFVSIHADGFKHSSANGASVFILSQGAASSKMAKILASNENKSDLIGGGDVISLHNKEQGVQKILLDLSMTRSMDVGMNVGSRVLKQLGGVTNLHSSRVEKAGFIVLKAPDVPSILVEVGFITNPNEANMLSTLAHRTKLSKAIFTGISSYFEEVPPEGSYLAWKKNGDGKQRHTIAQGDTLSSIANKYRVSINTLKQENNLQNSTIFVGQVLSIPAI